MPVRPVSHYVWQLLRTAKRSRQPLTGKQLRHMPTRHSRDGSFLTDLVDAGLLERVTGEKDRPFDATYRLTEKGLHAAEFGEYPYDLRPPEPVRTQATKRRK